MTDPPTENLLVTRALVERAKKGDARARDALLARYRPRLQRWASGRLPNYARSLLDTGDLVQETLVKVFERLSDFEIRGPGSFEAYVRLAILNRIKDQVRWARRRPEAEMPEHLQDRAPSPLEQVIGIEIVERYERAMTGLSDEERRLVHLRVELALGYDEIAAVTERTTSDAARVATQRALRKLAEIMGHDD
jgi:RNA polymerase sigma-70 factor (ECF subfamily)